MEKSNTLFLISHHGLLAGTEKGLLESHMWNLNENEESMAFLSLHKSKSERAHKGGKIVLFRSATEQEIENHQSLLVKHGKDLMQDTVNRKIIVFRVDPKWNKMWPKDARSHQMAYKGMGYVESDT